MAVLNSTVRAWEESVVIPTYCLPPPDRNPMFLEKRVYQGSSGKIYPNPFTDRISDVKTDKPYNAVFLENEYLRLMILPEMGGRIHVAQDKTNNYDFIYRQHVIKPALVGLLGPWISGGIEFNWPQHHRPSTYMPVEHSIEEHADGSRTVWLTEHEPMNRMKGTVGICLYPGKAIIEAKVRLYNRTPVPQTFLWWANVGIRVHDQYQAFFPPDVHFVADHARRAMSYYPIARNQYYGVAYDGVDISWYKNIPVPTSYMVTQSDYDFFGGYDYAKKAGVVHVADHHIAPGKKLWTWGNAEFGYAWDRELTDSDGPYIELMAGVYTDNQPDFSWLQPFETRTFSQFWYPIREIGPVKNANRLLAVNLDETGVGVCSTERLDHVTVEVTHNGEPLIERTVSLAPGAPFTGSVRLPDSGSPLLRVLNSQGQELIRYQPQSREPFQLPDPAPEIPPPAEIETNEELYLAGLHLEQYRHATRDPAAYWLEALARDPGDVRSNNALGLLRLRQGEFAAAEQRFRAAISRLTAHNLNPYDSEPFYNLGLCLKYQGRLDQAYAAFYKATWSAAWQSPSHYALATIDCTRGRFTDALHHLDRSLRLNPDHWKAQALRTWITEGGVPPSGKHDVQTTLDLAFDLAEAGLWDRAIEILDSARDRSWPMLHYSLGYFAEQCGDAIRASQAYERGRTSPTDYCFPARLEEMIVLEAALRHNAQDARAHYYLGNLLYDKHRRTEAISHWEQSCRLDPEFSIPWRNLGLACYNVLHDLPRAMDCYERAFAVNPADARLLYELDQLRKRAGVPAVDRLNELERHRDLVAQRDDLTIELVTLHNQTGESEAALAVLATRRFHPWEGGEGLVSGQYVTAHVLLGRRLLESGDPAGALRHFDAARTYPPNLGEGKHLLTSETDLDYYTGLACSMMGRSDAREFWRRAASSPSNTDRSAYLKALALRSLGDDAAAVATLHALRKHAGGRLNATATIDYFATSLPNFLLFDDDLQKRNRIECLFLRALAHLGLGRQAEAESDLQQLLTLDPNHLWAHVELKRLNSSKNEVEAQA
jgi:tetratricopeptide (TPR) repeat protein